MWKKPEDEPQRAAAQPVPANPAPAAPPAAPVESRSAGERAAIGASIAVVGDLSGDEDLIVHGRVEGKIDLRQHSVTVGRTGKVQADIYAKNVTIEGEVKGNLFASEQIVLRKSGHVQGNLTAPRVMLEDGSRFKGAIDMDSQAEKPRPAARPLVLEPSIKTGPV